jgi:hypothetical protein
MLPHVWSESDRHPGLRCRLTSRYRGLSADLASFKDTMIAAGKEVK